MSVEVKIAPLSASTVPARQGMVEARYKACVDPASAVHGVLALSFICGFTSARIANYTGVMVGRLNVLFIDYFCQQDSPPDRAWSVAVVKQLQAALIPYG